MGVYGNPNVPAIIAILISVFAGLAVAWLVERSYGIARIAPRPFRFLVAAVWGGVAGIGYAIVCGWGGTRVFPWFGPPEWVYWVGTFAVADGIGAIIVPTSWWWWKRCSNCAAGIDTGDLYHPDGGFLVLASTAYLCRKCGAATCRDCFGAKGACARCGAGDILRDIEVVAVWSQMPKRE